jgi:hypothetical protein
VTWEPSVSNSVPFSQHLTKKAAWTANSQSIHCRRGERQGIFICVMLNSKISRFTGGLSMLKFVILGVASLAFVGTAAAADLPRAQPQPVAAPVGKYPMGKYPVGKSPLGKYPVAAPAPLVTKG